MAGMNTMNENSITETIIGACIEVHREWGPGLVEGLYEEAVCHELHRREVAWEKQKAVSVYYKGTKLARPMFLDLLGEQQVILELKSIEAIHGIHKSQLRTYLRMSKLRVGLLINFNVEVLKTGIVRIVNNFPDPPSSDKPAINLHA
jgi:GxxExxY protein